MVEKDHAGGEGSCWWERIMLVGENYVVGEESCWWEKIMLSEEDSKVSRILISARKKQFE